MADMAKDLAKFKTKTAHSSVPVDTTYNTGFSAQREADLILNMDGPMDWDAYSKVSGKAFDWRKFVEDGCIEPKE